MLCQVGFSHFRFLPHTKKTVICLGTGRLWVTLSRVWSTLSLPLTRCWSCSSSSSSSLPCSACRSLAAASRTRSPAPPLTASASPASPSSRFRVCRPAWDFVFPAFIFVCFFLLFFPFVFDFMCFLSEYDGDLGQIHYASFGLRVQSCMGFCVPYFSLCSFIFFIDFYPRNFC